MSKKVLAVDGGHDIPFDLGKVILDPVNKKRIKEFFLNGFVALVTQEDLIDRGYKVYDFEGNLVRKKIPFINTVNAFAAVEIHHNAHRLPNVHGAEVIYHPGSKKGEALADYILTEIRQEGFEINGIKKGWWRYNPKLGKFYAFTSKIWTPAVIVECGYMTNKKDLQTILQDNYHKQMGRAIAQGMDYYVKSCIA